MLMPVGPLSTILLGRHPTLGLSQNQYGRIVCRGSFVEDYASQICGVMVLWQDLDEIHVGTPGKIEFTDLDSKKTS